MAWPTGDTLSPGWVVWRCLIPPDPWVAEILTGNLDALCYSQRFDPEGDILPSQAAAVFRYAWSTIQVTPVTIGMMVVFPSDTAEYVNGNPANGFTQFRKANGQSLDKADYPDLFAIIGYSFGGSGDEFNLPDLRGRVVVGTGTGTDLSPRALGNSFGAETHQLTSGEIPSHTHTTAASVTGVAFSPGELLVQVPAPVPTNTGATGGGGAHNNMQPSLVLTWYIQVTA